LGEEVFNVIRAFIAISIPEQILGGIDKMARRLKALRLNARFTKTSSIHLTLKFLGDINEFLVESVSERLEQCTRTTDRFNVTVERLGVFPNLRKPRVIWTGVRHESELVDLQQRLDRELETLGFELEKRSFEPHLTLARLKSSKNLTELRQLVESEGPDFKLGSFEVDEVHLYQSILRPEGAVYRRLATHALRTEN
jgi:2'-5' RNA ligase